MNRFLPLIILMMAYFPNTAQLATESIETSNIKTFLSANGSLLFDPMGSEGFEVNQSNGSKISTVLGSGLWIGARDGAGNINVTAVSYPTIKMPGFVNGPVNANDFNFSFDKVWKVSQEEILDHIAYFEENGLVDNLSVNIEQWPSNGNSFYSPALPTSQELAPFFDQNKNGLYEAHLGDYPVIDEDTPELIPSQLLFTIFHSDAFIMNPLAQIEIHATMYAFDCEQDEVLNNTIFTKHKLMNKSNIAYHDFRVALWQDTNLGCYQDDNVGCDTLLDMSFAYNGDPIDGNEQGSCFGGLNGFGDEPPVHSTVMLNQEMTSFIYNNNPSIGNPNPLTTDPQLAPDYFNFMNGLFREGVPLTVGADGLNFGSTDTTKYAFFDDPNDPNGWSMFSQSLPENDLRYIMSTGEDELLPGSSFTLDMAHVYTQVMDSDHIQTVTIAKENVADIQLLYDDRFTGSCALLSKSRDVELDEVTVFPNPVQDILFIDNVQRFSEYNIHTIYGELVSNGKLVDSSISVGAFMDSGVYILQLVDKTSGKASYAKFMVE